MYLESLSLSNFRNFARLDLDIPKGTLLISGRNAQGKTSLLEAVHFLATLSSFQADSDRQLVNFVEARKPLAVARIKAAYRRNGQFHNAELRIIKEQTSNGVDRARKEILLDGIKKKRLDFIGHFNAVLFLPQMLQILVGSPGHRRRYLDLALSQAQPGYAQSLSEYERIVSQRNALLKQLYEANGDSTQLDYWDEHLAKRAAQILQSRFQAVHEIDTMAGKLHSTLTHGAENFRIDYRPSYDPLSDPAKQMQLMPSPKDRSSIPAEKLERGLRERLHTQRREHIARGVTTIGPHRDELRFLGNDVDLGTYGSRGQIRTALLSLKLAELDWMHLRTGQKALLLLDEVLAELDEERRADLLAHSNDYEQVLITSTDLSAFPDSFLTNANIWTVDHGQIKTNPN